MFCNTFGTIALGGTPVGAPVAGWIADRFGARWALGIGAASGIAAAIVGILYLTRHCHLRLGVESGRLRFSMDESLDASSPWPEVARKA